MKNRAAEKKKKADFRARVRESCTSISYANPNVVFVHHKVVSIACFSSNFRSKKKSQNLFKTARGQDLNTQLWTEYKEALCKRNNDRAISV